MADIDTTTPDPAKVTPPETVQPDKAAADKLAADAAAKEAADKAEAERDAEVEKRAAARATKLAEKLANEKIAARDAEAKTKADREKMDVLEAAKLDKADLQAKYDKLTADHAAANLRAELAQTMVAKDYKPANESAMSYIAAAVQKHVDAGLDTAAALAAVRKDESFLFAQPQAPAEQPRKVIDTAGKPGGASEREVQEDGPKGRQYTTKNPGEIDPRNTAELNAAIKERHGFVPQFN